MQQLTGHQLFVKTACLYKANCEKLTHVKEQKLAFKQVTKAMMSSQACRINLHF